MTIKLTYPPVEKKRLQRSRLLAILRWPAAAAVIICPLVDRRTGAQGWSLVVLMSLYTAWTMVLSPDLVEYNRISQTIKLIACICILLALIDVFLAPGWAVTVVPLVCSAGLVVSGILFYTDLNKQKQNMLPMLLLIAVALPGALVGLQIWHGKGRMGAAWLFAGSSVHPRYNNGPRFQQGTENALSYEVNRMKKFNTGFGAEEAALRRLNLLAVQSHLPGVHQKIRFQQDAVFNRLHTGHGMMMTYQPNNTFHKFFR